MPIAGLRTTSYWEADHEAVELVYRALSDSRLLRTKFSLRGAKAQRCGSIRVRSDDGLGMC